MQKYIFTQPTTLRPPNSSHVGVKFEKGDVIEGTLIKNNKSSEPPNFIEVNTPQGKVLVASGGRGIVGDVLAPYNGSITPLSVAPQKKEIFTPKNIIIGSIVLGVLVIGGLKLAKVF